jgi:exosortase/archaeosortase family protein
MDKPHRRTLISALWFLPVAWLWLILINELRVEWTVNPQYSYGWAVPFLCAFLIWQRLQRSGVSSQKSVVSSQWSAVGSPSSIFYLLFALCALLYAPTRLVEEANPGWRLVSWALALETVGLTLLFIRLALGAFPLRHGRGEGQGEVSFSPSAFRFSAFVFPVCYFLVAVPWPTLIEAPLIQGLTRMDTTFTAELLGWLGIPAMPHGNVIEVATGVVGIDEACSGIRSFQATLMISLFLGELYSLGALRRVFCVFVGFALSFLFNLARMLLLVWVAARKGVAAIASWHDPAGVTILVACFFCLWGLGVLLKNRKQKVESRNQGRKAEGGNENAERLKTKTLKVENRNEFLLSVFHISAFSLAVWILLTEFSVEAWYRTHEARVPMATQWTVAWPTNNLTLKEMPLTAKAREILLYNEARSATWTDGDWTWQAVFLRWKPGRRAMHLAQGHTPEICLTAAGHEVKTISPQVWFDVKGLQLPFSVNAVTDTPRPVFVFYCLWDDRSSALRNQDLAPTYGNRLALVLAGQRNPGQRSLEIAVSGPDNTAAAEAALAAELKQLILPKQ